MAEKEGFEPSRPFRGLHDFQSCALDQLGDFSIHTIHFFRLAANGIIITARLKKSRDFSLFVDLFLPPVFFACFALLRAPFCTSKRLHGVGALQGTVYTQRCPKHCKTLPKHPQKRCRGAPCGTPPFFSACRRRCCPRRDPQRHPVCGCSCPPGSWALCRAPSSSPPPRRPPGRRPYRARIRYTFSFQSLLFGTVIV